MPQLHHRDCNLCEAMCGLVIEHDGHRVLSIEGDPEDPLSHGHVCTKAQALTEVYEDPDRLRRPLLREGDGWREAGWDEALGRVGRELARIRAEHGPDAVAGYVGNPTVHDYGAMLGATLLFSALGTAQRYSATSVDQLPRHYVSRLLYGHQGLLPVPDVDRTDLLLILGANPLASNGSLMSAPGIGRRLKALRRRGGQVVLIDPRRTETAGFADRHLFIRPGTDALLLLALLSVILGEGLERPAHLAEHLDGRDELAGLVARFPPERVASATGIEADEIRRLARQIAAAPSAALYGRVGACTQRFGGLTTWLLDAMALVTGNLDRPGGLMFTRPAVDLVDLGRHGLGLGRGEIGRQRSRVRGLKSFDGQLPAVALAEEIDTPGEGRVRGLVTLAGNPVLSLPDGRRLDAALAELDFMVSIDIYLNETTRHADVILPPPHALEQDHYDIALQLLAVRNTAKYSPPLFTPDREGRGSFAILADLARRLEQADAGPLGRFATALKWRLVEALGPRRFLALTLRLGPHGAGLNPLGSGLTLRRLERAPHGIDLGPLEPCLPGRLVPPGSRIPLVPEPLAADVERLEASLEEPRSSLVLIGRRHVKDNNSWLHNTPRLMRGPERCTLLMHPDDAAARGVTDGQPVAVASRTGRVVVPLEVSDAVMPGVVSLPHGYGHTRSGVRLSVASEHAGASINDLTDETFFDRLTGNAALNGVPVEVSPDGAGREGG